MAFEMFFITHSELPSGIITCAEWLNSTPEKYTVALSNFDVVTMGFEQKKYLNSQ